MLTTFGLGLNANGVSLTYNDLFSESNISLNDLTLIYGNCHVGVDCDGDGFDDIEGDVSCEYAAALRCQYQHSCNNELTSEAECGGTN